MTPITLEKLAPSTFGALRPEDVRWEPFPAFPAAARLANLLGEPDSPIPYVTRVKVPAGVKLMPHRHPDDRVYTVISGVFYIGIGEQFDETELTAYAPGSFDRPPGRDAAFPLGEAGEYITQIPATGPLGIEYVDPLDDPRTAQR